MPVSLPHASTLALLALAALAAPAARAADDASTPGTPAAPPRAHRDTLDRLTHDEDTTVSPGGDTHAIPRDRETAWRIGYWLRTYGAPTAPAPAKPDHGGWYGWQTLAADGASIGGLFLNPYLGASLFVAGTPVLHLAHENYGEAGISFGMRVVLPIVGTVIGNDFANRCSTTPFNEDRYKSCQLDRQAAGFFVGVAIAMAVDATVLAHDSAPSAKESSRKPQVGFAPWVDRTTRGVAVSGTF